MKHLLSILCLFVLSCDEDSDSLTEDCSGLLGGNAYINECGECMCAGNDPDLWECDDDDECEQDCNGEWGGDAEIDGCGECGGDDLNEEGYHCGDLQVLEDIIDTGITMEFLLTHVISKSPRSLKVAKLLYKKRSNKENLVIDYKCFKIDDYFVVGYGLDWKHKYRNLEEIYKFSIGLDEK